MSRLVVVGAGITGLTAAWEWRRTHPDDEVVLLEAGSRIGGKLDRVDLAGRWYDTGPEAVLARGPEAVPLIGALGLAQQLLPGRATPGSLGPPRSPFPLPPRAPQGVPTSAAGAGGRLTP